jgi:shikimate kinase
MFLLDSGAKVLGNRIKCNMKCKNNYGIEIETSSTQMPYIDRGVELHQAIKAGFSSIVCRLLSLGAEPNAREPLLERGAHHIAQIGQTPVVIAVSSSNKEVVQQLLDHGADINAKIEDHETRMPG